MKDFSLFNHPKNYPQALYLCTSILLWCVGVSNGMNWRAMMDLYTVSCVWKCPQNCTSKYKIKEFSNFFKNGVSFASDWFKRVTWLNMPQYRSDVPQLSNRACCKNIWRIINTIASIWLWKYARIFFHGHCLFRETNVQFPSTIALGKLFASRNR